MSNKISVITVVFNDVTHIRATLESFFSQTWEDKEYIVIDGGSTDGTAEIIKEYADRLAYWCSEKDGGIYDAMNKGIMHTTGDWINILNSGDYYASNDVFERVFANKKYDSIDVIYGDSIEELPDGDKVFIEANSNIDIMKYAPAYRHGSSFIRRNTNSKCLYDISRKELGFALDWYQIHNLYLTNHKFCKVNCIIEIYQQEGISNNPALSKKYNWEIINNKRINQFALLKIRINLFFQGFKRTTIYKWIVAFLTNYMVNDIMRHIPFWSIRKWYLTHIKCKIGKSFIMKDVYIMTPQKISIGDNSHINRGALLDGRGHLYIGNNVSISHNVSILTGSHDVNSIKFSAVFLPIYINDYVWIGANVTILQNVKIGKGAVICAGAIVTKDVNAYSIVAGIPAKEIGKRNNHLNYKCRGFEPFT